jgi:hypothetical protein
MEYVIRNPELVERVLTEELSPGSGLSDPLELSTMKRIRDALRKAHYPGEISITAVDAQWLRNYLSRWVQGY